MAEVCAPSRLVSTRYSLVGKRLATHLKLWNPPSHCVHTMTRTPSNTASHLHSISLGGSMLGSSGVALAGPIPSLDVQSRFGFLLVLCFWLRILVLLDNRSRDDELPQGFKRVDAAGS